MVTIRLSSAPSDGIPLTALLHMVTIRLSSSNYLAWQNQLTLIMRCDGLLAIIDGSDPSPSTHIDGPDGSKVTNPALASWTKRHDRCLSVLLSSLTEESMTEVLGLTSVRDIWLALERMFCPSTESRSHQLRDELQFLKHGASSVADYSRKFNSICHQLAAIGHPIPDADKSCWFIRGLGSNFHTFMEVRLTVSSLPSFADLVSQARDHELRNSILSEPTESSTQIAFFAGCNNHRDVGRSSGNPRHLRPPGRDASRSSGRFRPQQGHDAPP